MDIIPIPVYGPCVYVLCVDHPDYDLYIGATESLWARLGAHQYERSPTSYAYWHAWAIPCSDVTTMQALEDFLIQAFLRTGKRLANKKGVKPLKEQPMRPHAILSGVRFVFLLHLPEDGIMSLKIYRILRWVAGF
jgi:hypothetical protein